MSPFRQEYATQNCEKSTLSGKMGPLSFLDDQIRYKYDGPIRATTFLKLMAEAYHTHEFNRAKARYPDKIVTKQTKRLDGLAVPYHWRQRPECPQHVA